MIHRIYCLVQNIAIVYMASSGVREEEVCGLRHEEQGVDTAVKMKVSLLIITIPNSSCQS